MTFNIPDNIKLHPGVYILRSSVTDDTYIGATQSFLDRFNSHVVKARKLYPHHKKLRDYVTTYGSHTLSFDCLEVCRSPKWARIRERIHIRTLQPSLNTNLKLHRKGRTKKFKR